MFSHLLRMCVGSPHCNIFHQKVYNLIQSVFRSQNHPIINSIFRENQIIPLTLQSTNDFKQEAYFGYFFAIIQTYTSRRVNTPEVG